MKNNESNIWELWNNIKHANLHIIRVPEGKKREKGIKNVFEEITPENFPDLKKETYPDTGRKERKKVRKRK